MSGKTISFPPGPPLMNYGDDGGCSTCLQWDADPSVSDYLVIVISHKGRLTVDPNNAFDKAVKTGERPREKQGIFSPKEPKNPPVTVTFSYVDHEDKNKSYTCTVTIQKDACP